MSLARHTYGGAVPLFRILQAHFHGQHLAFMRKARHGATVDVAASALHALVALGRNRYDVLVTDLAMPHDDGFNLFEQLRREPTPNIALPAVALT